MLRMLLAGAAAASLTVSAAYSQVLTPDSLRWGPPPPGVPAGAELAVLSGDPSKEGMFTIRVRVPAGYTVPPHHHPTVELVTIIDGDLSYGMGATLDRAKASRLTEGGYFVAEAKMNHYVFSDTGSTFQITAHGPFEIIYVNAADDPRNAAKAPERGK